MYRLLLLLYLLLAANTPAFTQRAGKAHLQQFTTENGLPSNGIKGLQWDEKTEFLWIATEAGIVRFNGVDFRSYTIENTPQIASERMLFMTRNNTGSIYISDLTGNIFTINRNKPVLWRKAPGNINPYFGNYFTIGISDTFFNKQSDGIQASQFSAVTDKVICLSDTSCYIFNAGRLFYHSISLTQPAALLAGESSFSTIFKIENDCFIVNNKKEVFHINTTTNTITPVTITTSTGKNLRLLSGNSLYWETGMKKPVLTDAGNAWLFSYTGNRIIAQLIFTGLPTDAFIKSVQYSERHKILFIGTDSKGLLIMQQLKVETKKRTDVSSKNRNSYYSQIELADGNILTNEGDIISRDGIAAKQKLPVEGKFSYNVTLTNDSLLWLSQVNKKLGYACMHQYNKRTDITTVYNRLPADNVVTVTATGVYLANPRGIGILEADSMKWLCKYPKKMAGNNTFQVEEISPGILAVASCGGLLQFNTTTNQLDTIFFKENICVRSIWKYKEYIFFGTYGSGFYISKNGIVKPMPLDKNKYLLYTHCFVKDNNDYCWISTNRGLFKASLAALLQAYESNETAVYYHYFGKKDGMDMTELNGGCTPCALVLKNNTISFPTMDGLIWVDPEKTAPVLPEGDIYIDEIQVDNKTVPVDSLSIIQLSSKVKEIVITPGYSSWCNKENIYLDYQLNDSLHWKTINTDKEAVIRLSNLPPGKYLLRIRKLNGFGINNYVYKEIRFTIITPWHKQWWFYLLLATAAFGLFVLYYNIRTNQLIKNQVKLEKQVSEKTNELLQKNEALEKNNSINTRLISIISHDIVTPLKFLNVAGKNLLEKKDLMPEALKDETIKEITTTSKELQLLSTNILNWIKYQTENRRLIKESFNVHEMVNQALSVLYSLAKQKQISLNNETAKDIVIWQYFEPLKILVYNLVTNAINFSEKGSIVISCHQNAQMLSLTVKDEGTGMTEEQINNIMTEQFIVSSANMDNRKGNGLGYLIIKDLLKTMNATIDIKSTKGMGTAVSVTLPTGNNGQ